eukprot:COSAG02_NODE_122_length_35306_cov_98.280967_11_plen_125_part_00
MRDASVACACVSRWCSVTIFCLIVAVIALIKDCFNGDGACTSTSVQPDCPPECATPDRTKLLYGSHHPDCRHFVGRVTSPHDKRVAGELNLSQGEAAPQDDIDNPLSPSPSDRASVGISSGAYV